MSANDTSKIKKANEMVNRVYAAALLCIVNRTPFAIENPEHPMIWDLKDFNIFKVALEQ